MVIDEAHNLVPKGRRTLASQMIERLAAEGRKFGLFLIVVSQRPDKVSESVLSECDNLLMMKSTPTTVAIAKERMGIDKAAHDALSRLPGFGLGQVLLYGRLTEHCPKTIQAGRRRTQ